jgi:hypothetical protein
MRVHFLYGLVVEPFAELLLVCIVIGLRRVPIWGLPQRIQGKWGIELLRGTFLGKFTPARPRQKKKA